MAYHDNAHEVAVTSAIDERLQDHVTEALNNAIENGYDFDGWTTLQIAVDLCRCDAVCENHEPEKIADYVNRWLEGR